MTYALILIALAVLAWMEWGKVRCLCDCHNDPFPFAEITHENCPCHGSGRVRRGWVTKAFHRIAAWNRRGTKMYTVVGHCPKCGAPIHAPTIWHGITPPPSTYSCLCFASQGIRMTTATTLQSPASSDGEGKTKPTNPPFEAGV